MRTDEKYIRSLERRIKNQRMQLRWWNEKFERGDLAPRRPPFRHSAVDLLNQMLRRHGPWRISSSGKLTRRVKFKRPQKDTQDAE